MLPKTITIYASEALDNKTRQNDVAERHHQRQGHHQKRCHHHHHEIDRPYTPPHFLKPPTALHHHLVLPPTNSIIEKSIGRLFKSDPAQCDCGRK